MISHRLVAENWAKKIESKGSRMYADEKTIWSYGSHFPVAHHIGDNRVLFNTDRYSVSTSGHQSIVRYAAECENLEIIECDTGEIYRAVNYEDDMIIIKNKIFPDSLDEIMDLLRNWCKSEGVKRFPMKKLSNQIGKMVCLAKL